MYKKFVPLFIAVLWACAAMGEPNMPGEQPVYKPLPDGVILAGVDGTLAKAPDPNNKWFFTFQTTIENDRGAVKQGQKVEVLPSGTLEKMQSVMKNSSSDFRIWGRVTQFEGTNFIFPVYFLSIAQAHHEDANYPSVQRPISINEPNDVVKIPQEVLEKLTPKTTVELTQLSPTAGLEEDRMFGDRSGFIIKKADGSCFFQPDALGRKLQKISFAVLPNDILQQAMYEQTHEPDRVRFKITGILTVYHGQNYILLQRASRQFSHGNFAR